MRNAYLSVYFLDISSFANVYNIVRKQSSNIFSDVRSDVFPLQPSLGLAFYLYY